MIRKMSEEKKEARRTLLLDTEKQKTLPLLFLMLFYLQDSPL